MKEGIRQTGPKEYVVGCWALRVQLTEVLALVEEGATIKVMKHYDLVAVILPPGRRT